MFSDCGCCGLVLGAQPVSRATLYALLVAVRLCVLRSRCLPHVVLRLSLLVSMSFCRLASFVNLGGLVVTPLRETLCLKLLAFGMLSVFKFQD